MTEPLFLIEFDAGSAPGSLLPSIGELVELDGAEGRHAALVRRVGAGDWVLLSNGCGRGVRGEVVSATRTGLTVRVAGHLTSPQPSRRIIAVQALAKGDRAELAVEAMTEVGVDEIVPWQASRSVVRWDGDRGDRSRDKWQTTAREAAKQSRRLRTPVVHPAASTREVAAMIKEVAAAVVLHEEATDWLDSDALPAGPIMIIVGPEGGVSGSELAAFVAAGATSVLVSDGVLRTSTAGVVAVATLRKHGGSGPGRLQVGGTGR